MNRPTGQHRPIEPDITHALTGRKQRILDHMTSAIGKLFFSLQFNSANVRDLCEIRNRERVKYGFISDFNRPILQ